MKDYPQVSIRLPGDVKATLQALSVVSRRPQWRLVTESIECFLRGLPEAERRLVEELMGRPRARPSRKRAD